MDKNLGKEGESNASSQRKVVPNPAAPKAETTKTFKINLGTGQKSSAPMPERPKENLSSMRKDEISDEMKALFESQKLPEIEYSEENVSRTKAADKEPNMDGPPTGTIVSPDKLKDIFDKMTEIETNPNSRTAREFESKMMEMEKKNTNKRQG